MAKKKTSNVIPLQGYINSPLYPDVTKKEILSIPPYPDVGGVRFEGYSKRRISNDVYELVFQTKKILSSQNIINTNVVDLISSLGINKKFYLNKFIISLKTNGDAAGIEVTLLDFKRLGYLPIFKLQHRGTGIIQYDFNECPLEFVESVSFQGSTAGTIDVDIILNGFIEG